MQLIKLVTMVEQWRIQYPDEVPSVAAGVPCHVALKTTFIISHKILYISICTVSFALQVRQLHHWGLIVIQFYSRRVVIVCHTFQIPIIFKWHWYGRNKRIRVFMTRLVPLMSYFFLEGLGAKNTSIKFPIWTNSSKTSCTKKRPIQWLYLNGLGLEGLASGNPLMSSTRYQMRHHATDSIKPHVSLSETWYESESRYILTTDKSFDWK